jgi:phage FluMu protein Com
MITINTKPYRELRCRNCHKLICYEYVFAGRIAFSCPRCGELNEYDYKHLKTKDVENTMDNEFTINSLNKGGE